ncbi:prion-like-(Q/N-rich) domain-bearing protein 25 [Helicoverpa armigera]|uniref:prion-like-(Q/N-rich) domain-bearing protein 25 n=1 Tax=Helicoverpa armigera TaxID=29058 RepID=UPI00308282BC
MWSGYLFLLLGCILHSLPASAVWSCTADSDCSDTEGSVCSDGSCLCPTGQQLVLSGTKCAEAAPYYTSSCFEDFQCSNLFTNFHCRKPVVETDEESTEESQEEESEITRDASVLEGNCFCQPGFHYFLGRCWRSVDFGGSCTRDEDCLGTLRDPYNMACRENTCACAVGYYERQRGECRRIGAAVGDGCVIDEDCRFNNGVCNQNTFQCIVETSPDVLADIYPRNTTTRSGIRSHGALCGATSPCPSPFQCSSLGICVCPSGYYASSDGSVCLAELGSPATDATCVGFLAEVINGICTCPANVYFSENMRDCVKATRRLGDACVTDEMCHTFGAASRCGPPQDPWGFRTCECITEHAVWDESRSMCRLFAGVGEFCEINSDCLAGVLEIECVPNEEGQGVCTCPEGLTNIDGLCLTSGLELDQECQATQECTGTPNTICSGGKCSCDAGYQALDGICAPTIGGTCARDSDCTIEHTVCYTDSWTCQCGLNFLQYNDLCWPVLQGTLSSCSVSAQCTALLGNSSSCVEETCQCDTGYHLRDGRCWPQTGLFSSCSRSSECYLNDMSDRVQCRNSICQCSFDYPYSEELHTCLTASASVTTSSFFVLLIALSYIMLN